MGAALGTAELRVRFRFAAAGVHLQRHAGLMQVHGHRQAQGPQTDHADAPVRSGHEFVATQTDLVPGLASE